MIWYLILKLFPYLLITKVKISLMKYCLSKNQVNDVCFSYLNAYDANCHFCLSNKVLIQYFYALCIFGMCDV